MLTFLNSLYVASSYYTNRTGLAKRPSFGMYSCSGTESSLLNCSHSIYWSQGLFLWCSRTRVVGIKCPSLPGLFLSFIYYFNISQCMHWKKGYLNKM